MIGVTADSIQIPPFWPGNLEAWFAYFDALFHMHGIIAQRTKFDHIVAFLHLSLLQSKDLVNSPPPEYAYDVLKGILTKTTTASQHGKL